MRYDQGVAGLAALRAQVVSSYDTFVEYATEHGGTYTYTRQFDSVFGGYCETTVEVSNNQVVSRTERSGLSAADPIATWTEQGTELGMHDGCHPAVPMDALYEECLDRILCQDPRDNLIFVHVDARGLLVECRFFPMGCADDCYDGIEPSILTSDGTDWTQTSPECCALSAAPDCCMYIGGSRTNPGCGITCDVMLDPLHPKWHIGIEAPGCMEWQYQAPRPGVSCCGCVDADAGNDAGSTAATP